MPPRIHAALTVFDGSGAVIKGLEIDEPTAIARRKAGLDVVVCGNDLAANYHLAQKIEGAVGPWMPQPPHR